MSRAAPSWLTAGQVSALLALVSGQGQLGAEASDEERSAAEELLSAAAKAAPPLLVLAQPQLLPLLGGEEQPQLQVLGAQLLASYAQWQRRRSAATSLAAADASGTQAGEGAALPAAAALPGGVAAERLLPPLLDLCRQGPPKASKAAVYAIAALVRGPQLQQQLGELAGELVMGLGPATMADTATPAKLQALSSIGRVAPGGYCGQGVLHVLQASQPL